MTAIEFNHISKQYRLGLVSTRTLSHDLDRWFQTTILRREDPYLKVGEVNDRASKGNSEYVWALRDIDFKVEQGDVVGIIGKNGAGKSTLLKLLSKVTAPTTGTICANGRIASLLEVGTGFHQEMTGRENIYMNGAILGMTKQEITRKLDEIVDFSGCERYIDTPVKRYSSGMMVRLGFAVAAHLDPEILVVDEVLAVGDAEFQKKAIGKMNDISRGEGRTVLFVSHNMASIRALCRTGVLLDKGSIKTIGEINSVVDEYVNLEECIAEHQQLAESFEYSVKGLHITDFKVNNSVSNTQILQYPNRGINIQLRGAYEGKESLDIETSIYSETQTLIARRAQSLSTGKTTIVNNGEFIIEDKIVLPKEFTNGTYYLQFDLTHPKMHVLASTGISMRLNVEGQFTAQGISMDNAFFGPLYL